MRPIRSPAARVRSRLLPFALGRHAVRPSAGGVDIKEHRRNVRAAARNPPRVAPRISSRP
ncbi:hypothetical protein WS68_08230 [Burkholderia sp. TSV86]|nr:hypothetical protein WS68_08230 [Burkholderia sp. TSV86]